MLCLRFRALFRSRPQHTFIESSNIVDLFSYYDHWISDLMFYYLSKRQIITLLFISQLSLAIFLFFFQFLIRIRIIQNLIQDNNPLYIEKSSNISDAIIKISNFVGESVPVVDGDRTLKGVVTESDLFIEYLKVQDKISEIEKD